MTHLSTPQSYESATALPVVRQLLQDWTELSLGEVSQRRLELAVLPLDKIWLGLLLLNHCWLSDQLTGNLPAGWNCCNLLHPGSISRA